MSNPGNAQIGGILSISLNMGCQGTKCKIGRSLVNSKDQTSFAHNNPLLSRQRSEDCPSYHSKEECGVCLIFGGCPPSNQKCLY